MKKLTLLLILFFFFSYNKSNAQIYSPYYYGYIGIGVIYYPTGYYYGEIYNGYAHGIGSYYWADGSFFYGNYNSGLQYGAGVIVTRYYGYLSGCWYGDNYLGPCQNTYNPYDNDQYIKNIVSTVYDNSPKDNRNYQAYDPDGYKIIKVNPNTEMGKTLLGKYSK